jgi:AraC-like DNA-binding protein
MKQELMTENGLTELAQRIVRFAADDGIHPTAIDRLSLIRVSQPNERMPAVYEPCLCVLAQGRKRVILGDEVFIYDASHCLVASVDLPVVGEVLEATPDRPYLCVMLGLDLQAIASLLLQGDPPPVAAPARGMYLSQMDTGLAEAVVRLLRLLDTPEDIAALAPLVEREILYRLLKSPEGWQLRQMSVAHGHTRRIAGAIEWIKAHFSEPLRIGEMASQASMSPSSFHEHFRAVTAMSPLQYQKQLRLQEARRLLLSEMLDAATAGHRVGFGSPSQFSREYSRMFGAPPVTDSKRLRSAATG